MMRNLIGEVLFESHSFATVQVKINTINEKVFHDLSAKPKAFSPETYLDIAI